MNVTFYYHVNEAFPGVRRQVHAKIDGQFYRIFGEVSGPREVREVQTAARQPKVTGKKKVAAILAAVDAYVADSNIERIVEREYGVGIAAAPVVAVLWAAEKIADRRTAKAELSRANAIRALHGKPLAHVPYGHPLF